MINRFENNNLAELLEPFAVIFVDAFVKFIFCYFAAFLSFCQLYSSELCNLAGGGHLFSPAAVCGCCISLV